MNPGQSIERIVLQSIALALAGCLVGCDQAGFDPPRLVQLSCKPDKGREVLVFVLDTAQRKARRANAQASTQGKLDLNPQAYRLDIPATSGSQALQGVINRFDGRLTLIWGPGLPKRGSADAAPGPDPRTWRCKKEKAGPKL